MELDLHHEILRVLKHVYAGKKEVRLYNDHHGVPVSHPATIQGFNERGVIFKINKYQLVCLALEKHTYIQSELLPSIVKARLIDLDFPIAQVTLQQFAYTVDSIGRREFTRVQPQRPILVTIKDNNRKMKGQLADISETGLGVQTIGPGAFGPVLMRPGASLSVSLRLPGYLTDILLPGKICNISREIEPGINRLGILISPDSQTHEAIASYVSQRKTSLLTEMVDLYMNLSQGQAS